MISQQELNNLIDLLGDYVFALRFNLKASIKIKTNGIPFMTDGHQSFLDPSEIDSSIEEVQTAKENFYLELSRLYKDKDIPAVFTEKLKVMGNGCNTSFKKEWWGYEKTDRDHLEISISEMVSTLNNDFNQGQSGEDAATLLEYTGERYSFVCTDRISVGAKTFVKGEDNLPQTNFYFMVAVLSDPSALLISACFAALSAVAFASGAFIPGVLCAVPTLAITSCYAARKQGFFAKSEAEEPNITIEPYSFMNGMRS